MLIRHCLESIAAVFSSWITVLESVLIWIIAYMLIYYILWAVDPCYSLLLIILILVFGLKLNVWVKLKILTRIIYCLLLDFMPARLLILKVFCFSLRIKKVKLKILNLYVVVLNFFYFLKLRIFRFSYNTIFFLTSFCIFKGKWWK